jgi:hypothetical protein
VKIYLAANPRTAPTALAVAAALRAAGHVITSTWHDVWGPSDEAHFKLAALRSLDQIQAADVFVLLTEAEPLGLGNPWFELGVAYDKCMDCYVLGPKTNIFCFLPAIKNFEKQGDLLEDLNFRGRYLYRPSSARPSAVTEAPQ